MTRNIHAHESPEVILQGVDEARLVGRACEGVPLTVRLVSAAVQHSLITVPAALDILRAVRRQEDQVVLRE